MKKFLFIPLLIANIFVFAGTKYYVSQSGNNNAAGTSPGAAWQTIDKVNSSSSAGIIKQGDSIFFNRGDQFFGTIWVLKSNLYIGAYGTGNKPILYGYTSLTSFTNLGSNNYLSSVTSINWVNLLTIDGVPQTIARYPDLSAADGGYKTYQKGLKISNSAGYIIDNTLSGSEGWTGMQICIRTSDFNIDRCIVTSQHNDTIFYRVGRGINPTTVLPVISSPNNGFGYFILNGSSLLSEYGEWFYDSTGHNVTINFGPGGSPAGKDIRIAIKDTAINCGSQTNITIADLTLSGYNLCPIYSLNGNGLMLKNIEIINVGAKGTLISRCTNLTMDSVYVLNALSCGIQSANGSAIGTNLKNVHSQHTATIPGMGSYFDPTDYIGIFAAARTNLVINYCKADTTGFHGIKWQGTNVIVKNSESSWFCWVLQDGGGFYTYWEGGTRYYNRLVDSCIAHNGVGNSYGTPGTELRATGFYSDGLSMNTDYTNCTSYNNSKNGSHCNNCDSIHYINNTYYGNVNNISFFRWKSYRGKVGKIVDLVITGCNSYLTDSSSNHIKYTNDSITVNFWTTFSDLGTINFNRYNTLNQVGFDFEFYDSTHTLIPTAPYSLLGWQSISGQDLSSTNIHQYTTYIISSTTGTNKITNGNFTSGTGWNVTGTGTSFIYGTGSGTMTFSAPVASRSGAINQGIGSVDATKKYLLRFKTTGSGTNGITTAYLRKQSSPFNDLVTRQIQSFATTALWHEFLFQYPQTQAGASVVIEINQQSGTTILDSVSLYEVSASNNILSDSVQFYANPSVNYYYYDLPINYQYEQVTDSKIVQGRQSITPYGNLLDIFFRNRNTPIIGTNRIITPRRPENVP